MKTNITRVMIREHKEYGYTAYYVKFKSGRSTGYTTGDGGTLPKTVETFLQNAKQNRIDETTIICEL